MTQPPHQDSRNIWLRVALVACNQYLRRVRTADQERSTRISCQKVFALTILQSRVPWRRVLAWPCSPRSIFALAILLSLTLGEVQSIGAAEPPPHPNFIFILAEAQGWSSLSSPMDDQLANSKSDLNLTTHLDRLACQGMR